MPTNRTPLARQHTAQISERAVALFERMGRLLCSCVEEPGRVHPNLQCRGCQTWLDLQSQLHDELKARPWQWPVISRQGPKHAGSCASNPFIAGTMLRLREAVAAKRAAAKANGAITPVGVNPESTRN